MKVIKRDCTEVPFDCTKIEKAILKAMPFGDGVKPKIARDISIEILENLKEEDEVDISEIEKMVFEKLISKKQRGTARAYESYRSIREFQRETENSTDKDIEELLSRASDYWMNENSNKNPVLNTTVRDYIAGISSTDKFRRQMPPSIIQAHDDGLIHFHDADYYIQDEHNCDLCNLDDMLQNGTVISEVKIDKPKSFATACTVATQIIAQVSSSQYGGQSITLSHLAPFVDISRQKLRKEIREEMDDLFKNDDVYVSDEEVNRIAEKRLRKEVSSGIQTIQYQVVTLMTTNG